MVIRRRSIRLCKPTVRRGKNMLNNIPKTLHLLKRNQSGLAMVELAASLPFFMGLVIGGIETANYA